MTQPPVRDAWWRGMTRQSPFMATDLGCSMETVMAHHRSHHIAIAYGDIFGELIAASQALIRRCHSDREFRKKMIALWRAQMEQDTAVKPGKKGERAAQSE